jgi:serine/threonine protein kinase
MNCPNNCGEKLTFEHNKNSCKICTKKFCGDACLVSHIKKNHPDKISKPPKQPQASEFIKQGVMLTDIKVDPYFAFSNFEKVKINNKERILGSGAFGDVYLAKHKKDGILYAIKQLDKSRIKQIGVKTELIYREINIHLKLVHPNIARLYSYHEDGDAFYLIIEYVEKGTLFNLIQRSKGMNEEQAFKCFIQVAAGFNFLHENNLIHRDLKPENCLIDKNDNIKICDFGWTVESTQGARATFCGTYEYMAPEIVKEEPYNEMIDVWGLGILLYELLHSYSPFRVKILILIKLLG